MENDKASDHRAVDPVQEQAADLSRQALILYECGPGGPIVTNPADCEDYKSGASYLPELKLSTS